MSFFEDASLVLIPSAYKDQKVYSVKPTDGTGDLTFSRASSATRVQSDGLIEKVRTNVILQSNTFSNASWTKAGQGVGSVSVVTPNYTTDPFGGNNAWRFQCNLNGGTTSSDRSWMLQGFTAFADSVLSIYIKLNVAGSKTIILSNGAGNVQTITSTDWVRITIVTAGSSGEFRIGLIGGSTSDTLDCSIAFAQAETGDIATDYIATTTAAVSVGPVSGLPRLDYLGSTCPRLLLEPQRSNLVFFSEQLNNAGWAVNAVVTANTAVSPDGSTNADSVMESATTAFQIIGDPVATTSGTAYTYSFFAKPNGRNFARILFGNGSFPDSQSAYFNLLTGATSASASVTASMVSYGNGWYRCIATATSDASASDAVYLGPARNMTDGYATYAGNASLGIYAWGVQQEAGAYATSYIPTLGASVTRVADAASKTGISSLIGQTEGTIFFDLPPTTFSPLVSSLILIELDGNIAAGYAHLYKSASPNEVIFQLNNAGALQCSLNFALNNSTAYKIAAVYKNNRFELYVNGVLRASDYSGTLAAITMNKIQVAGDSFNANSQIATSQVLLFKTALTQAQCEQLTA
jgi:hypothetical protein